MAKQVIEFDGTVVETLPGGKFRVAIEGQEREVIAFPSGKMRQFNIKIVAGDRVKLEFSPYDLNNGRISFRYNTARPGHLGGATAAESDDKSDEADKKDDDSDDTSKDE